MKFSVCIRRTTLDECRRASPVTTTITIIIIIIIIGVVVVVLHNGHSAGWTWTLNT